MKNSLPKTLISRPLLAVCSGLYVLCGLLLFFYAAQARSYASNTVIRDLQWLNAWSLVFVFMLAVIWLSATSRRARIWLSMTVLSCWGVVAVALMFDGTPVGWYAYWGDQQFRTAMILKFMTYTLPVDFYYRGLPPFYPPLFFYLLAQYARLFGSEAYQMMKTGSMLIFALAPVGLYYFWTKLVSRFQACCIVIAVIVLQSVAVLTTPHELLAAIFFVPWWLYFVEGITNVRTTWRTYLFGGLLGGAVFMTYYFPFFLGAVFLLFRATTLLARDGRFAGRWRQMKRRLLMLAAAAVVASPFWLPLGISIWRYGLDSGQNRWFRIEYAAISFPFENLTLPGILLFAGVLYALRRYSDRRFAVLLWLAMTVPVFYLLGYLLGNFDLPVLYLKASEFLQHNAGVFVGLMAAGLLRVSFRKRKLRYVVPFGVLLLLFPLLNSFSLRINTRGVEVARKSKPAAHYANRLFSEQERSGVFLTGAFELPALAPAFMFIAAGEHYGHPAGRFHQRWSFLQALQQVADSYLFAVALRHNIFEAIDYLMPTVRGDTLEIQVNHSGYPEGMDPRKLHFSRTLLQDTIIFQPGSVWNLYAVYHSPEQLLPMYSANDSANPVTRRVEQVLNLLPFLDPTGQAVAARWAGLSDAMLHSIMRSSDNHRFGESIELMSSFSVPGDGDSILVGFDFKVLQPLQDYRISFHLWDSNQTSFNLDFAPSFPTNRWAVGSVVTCTRLIPKTALPARYELGFFRNEYRLEEPFFGRLSATGQGTK